MTETITARLERNVLAGRPSSLVWTSAARGDVRLGPGELLAEVRSFAHHLASRVPRRAVVPLLVEQGPALFRAFYGAIAADVIPSILAVPNPKTHRETYARNIARLLAHYRSRTLVIDASVKDALGGLLADAARELGPIDLIAPDAVGAGEGALPLADPASVAFLQHSSGTTGVPKGVALSHAKVLGQIDAYGRALGLRGDERIASWLPLYHDMGLIACCLLPCLAGLDLASLAPHEWVVRPESLLETIARERSTHVWLPNFAFAFLAKRVRPESKAGLDLGSLRAVVSCSEPVLARSMDLFLDAYSANGIERGVLSSSYAMAENVFAVTQTPPGRAPARLRARAETLVPGARVVASDHGVEVVSSGVAIEGTRISVHDPASGEALPERVVGEIWLEGDCLFDGYYLNPEATTRVVSGDIYRTGDLGFRDGDELYVLGRSKDLIIVGGRNFYPNDLEVLAGDVDGVKDGRVVAFGVLDEEKGTEGIVLLVESAAHEDPARSRAIDRAIRAAAVQQLDCALERVVVVAPGTLIKTSSGKLARGDNKRLYLTSLAARGTR